MYARHRLKTRGYIVLYGAVPAAQARALLAEPTSTRTSGSMTPSTVLCKMTIGRINDTFDVVVQDDYRQRSFVSEDVAEILSDYFERHYRTFSPLATKAEWRFVRMMSGAQDQPVRREFASPSAGHIDCANVCAVPGSLLIATQDQTYIYGYGWNNHVVLRSHQQLIELNQGDVLLSRGDFAFAGIGGRLDRTCVQGYIDTPLYGRPQYPQPTMVTLVDDTREVDDLFCFVWSCPYRGRDSEMLRKHLNRYHQFYFNRVHATTM